MGGVGLDGRRFGDDSGDELGDDEKDANDGRDFESPDPAITFLKS